MKHKNFNYEGYAIPEHLIYLTGGGTDTWDAISKYHLRLYENYTPIHKDDVVLEIGSGVGRDAIQFTKLLSKRGAYTGIDIVRDSILWCRNNISSKFPNFTFHYHDIESQIHNPTGGQKTTDIRLPIEDGSVDKIVLHSVFTHMFEDDIVHYLKEFRRVLKPDGVVLASFFLVDDEKVKRAQENKSDLTFKYPSPFDRDSLINDKKYPEGAVGFYPVAIKRMLRKSRMKLSGPIHLGFWSGIEGSTNGQDIFLLRASSRKVAANSLGKLPAIID